MITKVYNILKGLGLPVAYILRPEITTENRMGISYHFFNEGDELYGDGVGSEDGGSLQIDIFSTVDYSNIVNQVKALMKANKFRLADARDSYDGLDSNIQYYQKVLIFNYSTKEVLGNGS